MKRIVLILLCVIALPLYTYNVYLLTITINPHNKTASLDHEGERNVPSYEQLMSTVAPVSFTVKGRDPFTLTKKKKRTQKVKKGHHAKAPIAVKKKRPPPEITLVGVMWHTKNPVAIIRLENKETKTVRQHQKINGMIIKKIEKKRIVITVDGSDVCVEKR